LKHAPEMLEALAMQVFEGTYAVASDGESDTDDDETGQEDGEPGEA
jgi:hypothetical protein